MITDKCINFASKVYRVIKGWNAESNSTAAAKHGSKCVFILTNYILLNHVYNRYTHAVVLIVQ